jgi:hypothetical protein
MSLDLEYVAESCGWSFYRSAHHCDYCVTDVAFSLRQAADEAREAKKTSPYPGKTEHAKTHPDY